MIYRPLPDPVKKNLERIPEDAVDIFLLAGGSIRGVMVHATRLIHQARSNHGLSPLETTLLGKGLIAAALHCGGMKGKDRAVFKIQSSGACSGMSVEVNVLGEIRGHIHSRIDESDIPADVRTEKTVRDGRQYSDRMTEIGDRLIGSGTLAVTRYPEGAREPSTSSVPFAETRIDSIYESFYLQSEQVPTRIWSSFSWDNTLFLEGAAGLMLQTLPESRHHSREAFLPVVQYAASQDLGASLARLCASGIPNTEAIRSLFQDFDAEVVGSRGVEFFCSCTKERFATFMQGLPQQDRNEIRQHGPFPLVTTCHYCGSQYEFSREETERLLLNLE